MGVCTHLGVTFTRCNASLQVLKAISLPSFLVNIALKGIGTIVSVLLFVAVIFDWTALVQTIFLLFNFGIAIAGATEVLIAGYVYWTRKRDQVYAYRNFRNLGFLYAMSHGPTVALYRALYFIIGILLTLFQLLLVVLAYAHTSWMFNAAAAERFSLQKT